MNTYKQQLNMVQYAQVVTVTWYSFNFGVKSALSKKEKGRLYYKSNKKRKKIFKKPCISKENRKKFLPPKNSEFVMCRLINNVFDM